MDKVTTITPSEIADTNINGFKIHEDDIKSFECAIVPLVCSLCQRLHNKNLEYKKACPPKCDPSKIAVLLCQQLIGINQVVKKHA